jgi:HSP20 family protein
MFVDMLDILSSMTENRLDYVENDENGYVINVELPGFNKDEVNIDIRNTILYLKAEQKKTSDRKYHKHNVVKSWYLSNDINIDEISCKLENGVLTISLPKSKKEIKKIEIK